MVTLSANGSFLSLCCTLISVETVSVCGNFYILYYCARVQGFFSFPRGHFLKLLVLLYLFVSHFEDYHAIYTRCNWKNALLGSHFRPRTYKVGVVSIITKELDIRYYYTVYRCVVCDVTTLVCVCLWHCYDNIVGVLMWNVHITDGIVLSKCKVLDS